MRNHTRRGFLKLMGKSAALGSVGQLSSRFANAASLMDVSAHAVPAVMTRGDLLDGWMNIKRTYRPHTRWWWPGNAVTREGIRWELDQMRQQGLGGVELMTPWRMYADGNIEYLSPEHLEMVAFAVREAEKRDMEVAFSFCPGWKFGGYWVPPTQRSKVLAQGWKDISGPMRFDGELPAYVPPLKGEFGLDPHFVSDAPDENEIVAVVAAKIVGEHLDPESIVELTDRVENNRLQWEFPDGTWRLMAFRLKYTGEICATTENFPRRQWVMDHFSAEAVRNYCDYLGGKLYEACGMEFGKTLDTLFSDSFEVMVFEGTIHWSNAALSEFKRYKGYGLSRYLPAIWWDMGDLTPKIRYDVNDFLGWLGIQTFFKQFIGWGEAHHIDARIQPYFRFTEELIQGAGISPRPEMEVTTPAFEVVPDPRKAVAAGGHLYGREIISAEAYTFLHPQRYRTTLEEMKIASDAFLRDGVTQFYNHGYIYSPEMHVAPSRDMPWANRISHWNTWWKYYHHLTAYLSRCCYLLRQGQFAGDVLLYSPQANVWTQKVLFNNERRAMPYGNVGQVLVANGYDFDPVNDDILQNSIEIHDGQFQIRGLKYRFLILPSTRAVPLATMEKIQKFVQAGGVVIALGERPSESVGMTDYKDHDAQVKLIADELFGADGKGKSHAGGGETYWIPAYAIPDFEMTEKDFVPTDAPIVPEYTAGDVQKCLRGGEAAPVAEMTAPEREMVDALRRHLAPDCALKGDMTSAGVTFLHRRIGEDDVYFVTNLSPDPVDTEIFFRVPGKTPEIWDPMTGAIRPAYVYTPDAHGVTIRAKFMPYASTCYVFQAGIARVHLTEWPVDEIRSLDSKELTGLASVDGAIQVAAVEGDRRISGRTVVTGLPAPFAIPGKWKLALEGYEFERVIEEMQSLESWTENPRTRNFSGTGEYSVSFVPPEEFLDADNEVFLDLGVVGNVAEVDVNGRHAGVAWMRPYTLNVTGLMEKGVNRLEVRVTNTLINDVAGMEQLPGVPETLVPHYGETAHIYKVGAAVWRSREKGFSPLPPSGLIGPVMLLARRRVTVKLA